MEFYVDGRDLTNRSLSTGQLKTSPFGQHYCERDHLAIAILYVNSVFQSFSREIVSKGFYIRESRWICFVRFWFFFFFVSFKEEMR